MVQITESETYSLQYGTAAIDYSVLHSERKTMTIVVKPDCSVLAKVPVESAQEQIEAKIRKRAAWILRQQRYFRALGEDYPPRRYVSGESHWYMGRQYRLRINQTEVLRTADFPNIRRKTRNKVTLHGGYIEITLAPRSKQTAESLLNQWYRERAKMRFPEIAEPLLQRMETQYGVAPAALWIQTMPNRWGSCTKQGHIILNPELIKSPRACIEYVMTHELCHLVHPDHTHAFYDLLTRLMPDWQRWKLRLETFMRIMY